MQNQAKVLMKERVQKLLTGFGVSLKIDAFVYYGNTIHENERLI